MSDKQNPKPDEDESLPAREEESGDQSGPLAKSYYYDDATGYEIFKEEIDAGEEAEDPHEGGH